MRRLGVLLLVAGCNQLLGISDVHQAPDAGVDGAPPNTVTGTSVITYVKADGTTETHNEDLSGYRIRALIPDSSASGFQSVDGSGTTDGTFKIEGVPDGVTYTLELTRADQVPQLYVTKQRVIDAGFTTLGRPDAVSTTLTTPVTMTITGMTAWGLNDSLWADSYSTGTENGLYYQSTPNSTLTNPPTANATALTNMSVDWKSGYTYDFIGAGPRLTQTGDDFWVSHVNATITKDDYKNAATITRLVDVFQATGVNMTDGGTASASGVFTHVTRDKYQYLELDIPQYRALFTDLGRYTAEVYNCSRLTNYAVAYDGRIGPTDWGVTGTLFPRQTKLSFTDIDYGNPLAATQGGLISCEFNHRRRFKLPGGQIVTWVSGLTGDIPATDDLVRSPPIGMPTNITIGGQPFLDGGNVAFDGTAPVVVKWTAVPMATKYIVLVRHLYVVGNTARADIAANLSTSATEVSIPASYFVKGDFYNIQLTAVSFPDKTMFTNGKVRRAGFPTAYASLISGMFRFSSDCGNHVVDAGEDCDDGGESATCDTDCTTRSCGDGLINATALEACDNEQQTPMCNANCTVATCGDLVVNATRGETCDDGNQNVGDGCSPKCTTEACGSGVVDPGEQCDDGNSTNGDGCSMTCQIEATWTCDTTMIPSYCHK